MAKDIPSWVKGHAPYVDENESQFAKRLMGEIIREGLSILKNALLA